MFNQRVVTEFRANTGHYTANVARAARQTENFKRSMRGAGQMKMTAAVSQWEDLGRSISNAGRNIATVSGMFTAAAAGIVISTSKIASSFEDAFADFRKVTDATDTQFAEMDRILQEMTKRIPATYEEIAGAAASASRLGVPIDEIENFTETVVMMGTATNMTSEEAAENMARFSNIMGTPLSKAEQLGSSIVDLGNQNCPATERFVA